MKSSLMKHTLSYVMSGYVVYAYISHLLPFMMKLQTPRGITLYLLYVSFSIRIFLIASS